MFDNQFNTSPSTEEQDDSGINPINLVLKYIHHWKWVALSVFIAFSLGVLFIKRQTPIYSINTTVLMNDKSKGTADIQALSRMTGNSGLNSNSLENEMMLLRSKNLMLTVAHDLQLYVNYSQKFRFRSADLYKRTPVAVSMEREVANRIQGFLAFEITPLGDGLELKGSYQGSELSYTVSSLPAEITLPFGNVTFSKTPYAAGWKEPVKMTMVNPLSSAGSLSARIQVAPLLKQGGSILRLNITDSEITRGVDILNKVVEVFNDNAKTTQNEKGVNTHNFINERLLSIQQELSVVEGDVEEFKRDNKLVGIVADGGGAVAKVNESENQLAKFHLERTLLAYIEEYIGTPEHSLSIIPNLGVSDPSVKSIIGEYNQLIAGRDRLLRTSSANNPTVVAVDRDIESMRGNILTGIDLARRQLDITEKEARTEMDKFDVRLGEVPRQQRELTEILRQQKIKEGLYIFLLEKREENALTMALAVPEARIIEDPVGGGQVAPKGSVILLMALAVGVAIPVGIILLLIILDVKIHDRHDIEALSKLPILGELCSVKEAKKNLKIVISKNTTSAIAELFRAVRNNLQFLSGGDNRKVITITSNLPNEGKSFVSANMAATFALTGKKVLIIGLDLRNPQLHHVFDVANLGMTNYLSGQTSDWKSLVKAVPEYESLDFFPAGPVPPNPNELLMSPRLESLMQELRAEYDYIIIDSAPVGVISDTFLINTVTDTNVFVVRAGQTAKKSISFVNRIMREGKLSNLYFLVCDVSMESNAYRYGRYGYGYGYYGNRSYGYGNRDEKNV